MLPDENDLYDEIRELSKENDRLLSLLSVGMYYVCFKCREESDKRAEQCTATKWKEKYDKQCQEVKRLKEILNKLTGER